MKTAASPAAYLVWLIEDHDDFRTMVAWQINQIPGFKCARQFTNCEAALAALQDGDAPQVILCDIGLPGMGGIAGIREIKNRVPSTHVIVLTVYDDHEKVFNAICAGASGYLLKSFPEETIGSAIREVIQGGAPMHPRVARMVLDMFSRQNVVVQKTDYNLSLREREILEFMIKGMINKEIADQLGVSFHTVNNHLRSIYRKLHVHTRGGAVAKALKEGIALQKE